MKKFKNKYRITSARAPFWDYGWNAAYFVTICTQNREHYFGKIITEKDTLPFVSLSDIGNIAQECWCEIPNHFPFVKLGSHIIMPNHVHGIIIIHKTIDERKMEYNNRMAEQAQNIAPLSPSEPSGKSTDKPKNQFGPQSKNLASIIRGFKIGVTKNARIINPDFAWQSRFHDHIIRDYMAYKNIANYIITNPTNWKHDKLNL